MTQDLKAHVGVQRLVPLLMVKSMDASLRFYLEGLGFTLTRKWTPEGKIRWCWLELGSAAVMLQERGLNDRRNDLEGDVGAGVGLYFICEDALAFYHLAKERGITVERPFVGNRMWVVSAADPDGYRLHFESPTDVAEETVYRE